MKDVKEVGSSIKENVKPEYKEKAKEVVKKIEDKIPIDLNQKKNRIYVIIGIVVVAIVLLMLITGDSSSEEVKAFKKQEFSVGLKPTGMTVEQAMNAVMNNVKWNEYIKDDFRYLQVTGIEKRTGYSIEIVFKFWNNARRDITRERVTVNGDVRHSYFETGLFRDF